MATIIQPYNPWKEQLALTALGNVAGNILSDLWKTHQQNEQNRKANAFRGQLQQNLQNAAQPEISLTPKEAPQGYNSNPWANALHQNYTPLTAFDIGTSTVGKTPSIQDIVQGADSLAASKRFSMLSPELVQGVKNSIIQQSIADMFGNAGNVEEQMRALTMGAARGVVAPQVLMAFSPYARDVYSPYTFQETDLGQNKVLSALNKHTGVASPGMIMPVSVSPNIAENNATSRYVADRSAESSRYASDTQRYGYDSTSQWRNRELEDEERQREYERQNPQLTVHTDADGNVQTINTRTGTATNVRDEAGNQVTGEMGHYQIDVARMNALNKQYQELSELKKNLQSQLSITDDPERRQYFTNELEKVDAAMAKNWEESNTIYERNKRKTKTAATPTPAENTPGGFWASGDVQPVPRIMTLTPESADVRPTAPIQQIYTPSPTAQRFSGRSNQPYVSMSQRAKNLAKASEQTQPQNVPSTPQPAQPITALTPESADVRPTAQATQPPKTNSSQSYTQRLYSQYLARNNIPDDTSTVRQPITALTTNNAPQAPAQLQAPKPAPAQTQSRNTRRSMREFTVSDDMAYDPVRDKDIPSSKIYTEDRFRNFIKNLQENDPYFAGCSTDQLIDWAYAIGIRIRQ